MNKDMNKELQRLISKYNLEELADLKVLLDSELVLKVSKLNTVLGINNITPVASAPTTSTPTIPVTSTEIFAKEIKKEETPKATKNNTKVKTEARKWDTIDMEVINKFNKVTKDYDEFTTDKEGVIYCTTSNYDPSILGGQLGHNGKIYNFIYSTKFELPVVLGDVTLDYLKEIKDKILADAPKDFIEAEKLATKYMTDYGYLGRFYYDELEQGTFIFKTKDGYKGFTQGMSFRVAIDEDTDKERIYTLKNGFFFSQNYENAKSSRQMRLYPNLVDDIKVLITKVNEQFINYDDKKENKKVSNLVNKINLDSFFEANSNDIW